jgi:hypothetical protein
MGGILLGGRQFLSIVALVAQPVARWHEQVQRMLWHVEWCPLPARARAQIPLSHVSDSL